MFFVFGLIIVLFCILGIMELGKLGEIVATRPFDSPENTPWVTKFIGFIIIVILAILSY